MYILASAEIEQTIILADQFYEGNIEELKALNAEKLIQASLIIKNTHCFNESSKPDADNT